MAALQRRAHKLYIADALEAVIHAAVGHVDDHFLNRFVVILRIDKLMHAQLTGNTFLCRVDIDTNDAAGTGHLGADDGGQTDTAQTEDGNR